MKRQLNLTIDESLLQVMEKYVEQNQTTISELVENYFKTLVNPIKHKTIIDLVEELGPHGIDPDADLKELYYQDPKHGGCGI